jgi:hypothetical protein
MKNLIFGAVFALFTLTSFASNEIPNENLLPITDSKEVITIAEDNVLPMPDCFYIGNMIFDALGESEFTVWLANQACNS